MKSIEEDKFVVELCEADGYFSHLYDCYQQDVAGDILDGVDDSEYGEDVEKFIDFCYHNLECDIDDAVEDGDANWLNNLEAHLDELNKEVEKVVLCIIY